MSEGIDDFLPREDAVGGDEASELDSLPEPGHVLCERARCERRSRQHAERRANEFTAYHLCVRSHSALLTASRQSLTGPQVVEEFRAGLHAGHQ